MFIHGIGKAAVMPVHRWLPSAMVAPTPVSALLHAVAVVKAGVFSVVKIIIYIFSPTFLSDIIDIKFPLDLLIIFLRVLKIFTLKIPDNLNTRIG